MGSFTAHILVGTPHPNHGGIIPSYSLSLSENDSPAWVLVPEGLHPGRSRGSAVTWIPSREHPLEDAILMVAIHVVGDPEVRELAESFCESIDAAFVTVSEALDQGQRAQLYERCRQVASFPKLAVSVYDGSLIARDLHVLESYDMDVEVCPVVYSRWSSGWTQETRTEGSLEGLSPHHAAGAESHGEGDRRERAEQPAQAGMDTPSDQDLPFFAYGVFKPGELAFFQVRDSVSEVREAEITGCLLLRDGLPIVDIDARESVRGSLLQFAPGRGAEAYARISAMEPGNQYRWGETDAGGVRANVLVARSPQKGSVYPEEEWSSWNDPLFIDALDVVTETLDEPDHGSHYRSLFRVQMAYLLLWSSIEHYVSLRYCLSDKAVDKIGHLADEEAFARGLLTHVKRTDRVYRADRPRKGEKLDAKSPRKSLDYYYQLRSNITHRGKRAFRDRDRLRSSIEELLPTFRGVLAAAQADAGWPGDTGAAVPDGG